MVVLGCAVGVRGRSCCHDCTAQPLVDSDAPGFYHCVSRCVRRAFLCGTDAYTGRCFENRKPWGEERLLELADIFAVGVYDFAGVSNHLHW